MAEDKAIREERQHIVADERAAREVVQHKLATERAVREVDQHKLATERAVREVRQHNVDISKTAIATKIAVPILLFFIAVSQAVLAWTEHSEKKSREEAALTLAYAQMNLAWAREISAQYPLLFSANPEDVCRAVEILRLGSPPAINGSSAAFFFNNIGRLKINALMCYAPAEMDRALASYRDGSWGKWRAGADGQHIRRDPVSKQLFSYQCDISAITRGESRQGTCSLPANIDGKIYKVEYVCAEFKCGWSYGAKIGDYAPVYEIAEKKMTWNRIWDGDAHAESYILYYEIKQPDGVAPRE